MQNRCQSYNSDNVCAATRSPIVTSRSRSASRAKIKIKLRVRMFRFWRSGGESAADSSDAPDASAPISADLQVNQADRTADSSSTSFPTASTSIARSPTPNQHHSISIPFHNNSHSSLLTHGTNDSLATHSDELLADDSSLLGSTKLWQSLVLPMLLACVIFLVALWARQISRALTNDAIVMMLIMVCIFVVMSAVAFWLSCDHFFKSESGRAESLASRGPSPVGDNHFMRHHAMCPHHRFHQLGHYQSGSGSQEHNQHHYQHPSCLLAAAERVGRSHNEKCCHISVIDCQPPDYQSALLNSVPIQQYLLFGQDDEELNTHQAQLATLHVVNIDADSILSSGDEHSETRKGSPELAAAKQLYLFPPSYEELSKK